jgi:hypothetical protein
MYHRRSGIAPCPEDKSDYYYLEHLFKLFLVFFLTGQGFGFWRGKGWIIRRKASAGSARRLSVNAGKDP